MKTLLDEILEKLPEAFVMLELSARAEEKTPYVLVALQECERMNNLTREIRRSLKELDLGLKVRFCPESKIPFWGLLQCVHYTTHVCVHIIPYTLKFCSLEMADC